MSSGDISERVEYFDSGVRIVTNKRKVWSGLDDPKNKSNYNAWSCMFNETSDFLYKDPYDNILSSPGIGTGYSFPQVGFFPTVEVVNELHDRLRDSQFDGLVFLYELDESVAMLAAKIKAFYRFIKDLKRGNFGRALNNYKKNSLNPNYAKELASRWLEFYYGWLPLIKDITDLITAIKRFKPENPPTYSIEFVQTRAKNREYFSDTFTFERTWRTGWNLNCEVRSPQMSLAGILDLPDFPFHIYDIWNKDGFHYSGTLSEDLKELTWRLIEGFWNILPFSFVIDWFIQVGDYLSAYANFDKLDVQRIYYTLKHSVQTIPIGVTWLGAIQGYELLVPNVTRRDTLYERGILTELTLSPPTIDLNYKSLQHAINSCALITKVLPNTRRR